MTFLIDPDHQHRYRLQTDGIDATQCTQGTTDFHFFQTSGIIGTIDSLAANLTLSSLHTIIE